MVNGKNILFKGSLISHDVNNSAYHTAQAAVYSKNETLCGIGAASYTLQYCKNGIFITRFESFVSSRAQRSDLAFLNDEIASVVRLGGLPRNDTTFG